MTLSEQPALPPPPGVTPNFAHPKSRASVVYITAGICLPLILIFAALRFYAKITIMKRIKWDDALRVIVTCIIALLFELSFIAMVVALVNGHAYGFHQWDITIADLTKENSLLLALEIVVGPSLWFIKLAIFVLYLNIFGLLRWLRYCIIIGAFTTGAFCFSTAVVWIVMCRPTDYQSQSYLGAQAGPRCHRTAPLKISTGVVNLVSDLYLILIPLPAVWSLQMPLPRKISVSAMFLTGLIACTASVFSLIYRTDLSGATDRTWVLINFQVASIIEMTAGVIVCCMPTAAAVFKTSKSPVSSFIATCRRGLGRSSTSSATIHQEQLGSSASLRPSYGGHGHQRNCEISGGVQKPWSDPEIPLTEWQHEHEILSAFPLENTKIRKTIQIEVTQSSESS